MNKATFSRLIKDSTHISDADVLALEQVVQAFPYCQTAHMLLAKAAADKGSMLAPQRLRKAAIHAPSRAILKKLVEGRLSRQEPEHILSQASGKRPQLAYTEEIEDLIENDLPAQRYTEKQAISGQESTPAAAYTKATEKPEKEPEAAELIIKLGPAETEEEVAIAEAAPEEIAAGKPEPDEAQPALAEPEKPADEAEPETSESEGLTQFLTGLQEQNPSAGADELDIHPDKTEARPEAESAQETVATTKPEPVAEPETAAPEQETAAAKTTPAEIPDETGPEELPEQVLPEQETAEKQVSEEFTLANPPETAVSEVPASLKADYSDSLVVAIFRDNELGYAMSSSRMGESLQRKSELTREVPFHFQPELLVEYKHSATQTAEAASPAKAQTPPQQDLIDDFLKQASKSRPRAGVMPKQEEQEDLSQKSTRLSKSIVSENLAQIFAMQGKTKKAIKIYQQLQLKMPEKKDYFAVQINKLQNHSS